MLTERLKNRKNFLPTAIIALILWIIWVIIFFSLPPEYFLLPYLFLLLSFLATLFTTSLIFANTRRGIMTASGVLVLMILSYLGLGNYLNIILIIGILVTFDYYITSKDTRKP